MASDTRPDFTDERYFRRQDGSDDSLFYQFPRRVIHVADEVSARLSAYHAEVLPEGGQVLDVMSSWRSHIAEDNKLGGITGLGMNAAEMDENPVIGGHVVHDLNKPGDLPFPGGGFDAAILCFSFQYLTRPVETLRDIARVLKPGAWLHISYSNRLFPTKAVAIWQSCSDTDRAQLIGHYLQLSGRYTGIEGLALVPGPPDPLFVVRAKADAAE